MYDILDDWDSWDEVVYDSLEEVQEDAGWLDCEAYYGKVSHISVDEGQPQPLDDELFQPADLLELFRYVSVIHMTGHIEDAIDILRDAKIAMNGDCRLSDGKVICGRLEITFPAIPVSELEHYLESVK